MEKQMEVAHVERGIGTQDRSPEKEKEKSHRDIFHLHHHSKDEKDEKEKKKKGSKREKIAKAMVGLGAKIKHPRHGGQTKEEGEAAQEEEAAEEEEGEEEEEEEDEGDDSGDEEEGGKFSAFISMIAEAFEE